GAGAGRADARRRRPRRRCPPPAPRDPRSSRMTGCVALVGAGPGDPGLMTVRGLAILRKAQVVVYDRLIDPRLLDEAPPRALRVFVGKASGAHTLPQSEINALLVAHARCGQRVVRLKGGGPFVFGRGGGEGGAGGG